MAYYIAFTLNKPANMYQIICIFSCVYLKDHMLSDIMYVL